MKVPAIIRSLLARSKVKAIADPPVGAIEHHPLNETRDEAAYRSALADILGLRSQQAAATLQSAIAQVPVTAKRVDVMVHPSQDADGLFSVLIHLDGPDLHVLNKAVEPHRTLFACRMTPTGPNPLLPMFDPFNTTFSVNDAIVDVVADWVESFWGDAGGPRLSVPATVSGEDSYGTTTPRRLQSLTS